MEYGATDFMAAFRVSLNFAVQRLMPHRFDLAFCGRLGLRTMSIVLAYMSGARQRIAYTQDRVDPTTGTLTTLGWDCMLTTAVPFPTGNHHDVEMDFGLLEHLLQLPVRNRSLEIWYTRQDEKFAQTKLAPLLRKQRRLYAVVPGASAKRKQWPIENYVKLLRALREQEKELAFVVLGGPGEGPLGEQLKKALGDKHVVNLAGATNFRQAGAALACCKLYIGSDTSLLHMATALGLPVLTVQCFAASLPKLASSIPARFYPYDVPSVVMLPETARDGCQDALRYGCERENEMHCICGVTPESAVQGYAVLQRRIKENATVPMFLK